MAEIQKLTGSPKKVSADFFMQISLHDERRWEGNETSVAG